MPPTRRRFGEFEIDDSLFELRRRGTPVHIPRKAFNLLLYLVERHQRVVTKDELFAHIWPGEVVGEAALTTCINTLRHCIGDHGRAPRMIESVRGRGYRFVADTHAIGGPTERHLSGRPPDAGPAEPRRTGRLRRRVPPRLRGRAAELEALVGLLRLAVAGRGQVAVLVGDPGIGKTRLAAELAQEMQAAGGDALVGRAPEIEGGVAFWPWSQILRDLAASRDDAALARVLGTGAGDIAQLVGSIRERLPDAHVLPVVDGEQARLRLFESVTDALLRAAGERPLLVTLDDLHWADRSSLLLWHYVCREVHRAPVMLVGTYRDVEVLGDHPRAVILAGLAREGAAQTIHLTGLSAAAVRQLVTDLDGSGVPEVVVETIVAVTEGNPLFVAEMLDHLCEGGLSDASVGMAGCASLEVPEGVRDVIGRRLTRLSEPCRQTLRVASALGREFSNAELECADGCATGDTLLDLLDEAVAMRVLAEVPGRPGRFAFAHALFREVLYQGMSAVRRSRVHQRIGQAFERFFANQLDAHLSELAHHFVAAQARDCDAKAIEYATAAAERASTLHAYDDAAIHVAQALDVLERTERGSRRHCHLVLALGEAQVRSGRPADARPTFERAAELAIELGDLDAVTRAALGVAGRELRSFGIVMPEAVRTLELAVDRVGDRAPSLRSQLLARLALALRHDAPSMARRRALGQEAVALARRSGTPAVLASVLDDVLSGTWRPDNLDERLRVTAELLELVGGGNLPEMQVRTHGWRFVCLLEAGELRGADAALAEQTRLAEALRLPVYRWDGLHYRATRALMDGRLADGESMAMQAFASRTHDHPGDAAQAFGVQLALLRWHQGRMGELAAVVDDLADQFSPWRVARMWVLAEAGRLEEARKHWDAIASSSFDAVPFQGTWLDQAALLAMTCHALHDGARARVLYERLRPYDGRLVVVSEFGLGCMGAVSRYLGLLAATARAPEQAAVHFEAALALHERLGMLPDLVRTQLDYARTLCRMRGRERQAERLIHTARDVAERLDLAPVAAV